jgi:hypothetical protein
MAKIFWGTEVKLNISIDAIGELTMDDYDFEVTITAQWPKNKIVIKKDQAIRIDENNYVITLDTTDVGTGNVSCKIVAYLPDDDFEDGFRTEVVVVNPNITIAKTL